MSIRLIDVGEEANDETGDTLRDGGIIINENFAELDTRTAAAQAKADQGVADAAAARAKADAAVPAAALGTSVAQLINGVVPASQLPSFVDDVLEFPVRADFPAIGETGKIYIAINDGDSPTNPTRQYRWSGAAYVLIPSSPGSTDQVPEGSTNKYFTAARVRSTTLPGIALSSNPITEQDTTLAALGKLQGQINERIKTGDLGLGGQLGPDISANAADVTRFYRSYNDAGSANLGLTAGIHFQRDPERSGDIALNWLDESAYYRISNTMAGRGSWIKLLSSRDISTVTNANGTATKFPDGTMICRCARKDSGTANLAIPANLFMSSGISFTWPVPFVGEAPIIAHSSETTAVTLGWSVINVPPTLTGISDVRLIAPSTGAVSKMSVIAVGRWK